MKSKILRLLFFRITLEFSNDLIVELWHLAEKHGDRVNLSDGQDPISEWSRKKPVGRSVRAKRNRILHQDESAPGRPAARARSCGRVSMGVLTSLLASERGQGAQTPLQLRHAERVSVIAPLRYIKCGLAPNVQGYNNQT